MYYFYKLDIQSGIHDPDIDATYTMKIFKEKYITDKLVHPEECFERGTFQRFNEIPTFK